MKKQILSIFLCILCILSLIGCGKKKNTKSAEIVDNNITSEEESVSDEYFEVRVFNSNYNISGWDSLQSMQSDFDLNSFKIIDVLGVQFKPDDFVLINSTPDNVFDCIFKIRSRRIFIVHTYSMSSIIVKHWFNHINSRTITHHRYKYYLSIFICYNSVSFAVAKTTDRYI